MKTLQDLIAEQKPAATSFFARLFNWRQHDKINDEIHTYLFAQIERVKDQVDQKVILGQAWLLILTVLVIYALWSLTTLARRKLDKSDLHRLATIVEASEKRLSSLVLQTRTPATPPPPAIIPPQLHQHRFTFDVNTNRQMDLMRALPESITPVAPAPNGSSQGHIEPQSVVDQGETAIGTVADESEPPKTSDSMHQDLQQSSPKHSSVQDAVESSREQIIVGPRDLASSGPSPEQDNKTVSSTASLSHDGSESPELQTNANTQHSAASEASRGECNQEVSSTDSSRQDGSENASFEAIVNAQDLAASNANLKQRIRVVLPPPTSSRNVFSSQAKTVPPDSGDDDKTASPKDRSRHDTPTSASSQINASLHHSAALNPGIKAEDTASLDVTRSDSEPRFAQKDSVAFFIDFSGMSHSVQHHISLKHFRQLITGALAQMLLDFDLAKEQYASTAGDLVSALLSKEVISSGQVEQRCLLAFGRKLESIVDEINYQQIAGRNRVSSENICDFIKSEAEGSGKISGAQVTDDEWQALLGRYRRSKRRKSDSSESSDDVEFILERPELTVEARPPPPAPSAPKSPMTTDEQISAFRNSTSIRVSAPNSRSASGGSGVSDGQPASETSFTAATDEQEDMLGARLVSPEQGGSAEQVGSGTEQEGSKSTGTSAENTIAEVTSPVPQETDATAAARKASLRGDSMQESKWADVEGALNEAPKEPRGGWRRRG